MEEIKAALLATYLIVSCYFSINWLRFCKRSPQSSVEDGFLSFVVLVVTTTLWPLVIPIFVSELLKPKPLTSLSQRRPELQIEVELDDSTSTAAPENSNLPAL